MSVSVTDPITKAIARAKLVCFQPFAIGKWFVLGFCAFLASLDEGGTNFNSNMTGNLGGGRTGGAGGNTTSPFDAAISWISTHHLEVGVIAAVVTLTALAIYLVLAWLCCRGKFMFIDGIAKNTAEVVAPWKRYRRLGNSLFRFRVGVGAALLAALLLIGGLCLLLAWQDIQNKTFGSGAVLSLVVGILLTVPTFIIIGLIDWSVMSFVTVIMYARDTTVGPAWREFRANVVRGNVGSLILFLLMSIVLGIAVALVRMVLGCVTLCVGFLPYISSVVALPLSVFTRSYSIYFIQQFGPQYTIISEPPPGDYGFQVVMPPTPVPPGGN